MILTNKVNKMKNNNKLYQIDVDSQTTIMGQGKWNQR